MKDLVVNGERLWHTIEETARFGGTGGGGVTRLALTDADRQVRDWFARQCQALGCSVTVDDMGNMFARRPGRDNSLPPVAVGSHLDTQPSGGRFDGIVGVLAGLEILCTLHDADYTTDAPVEVINWTNEEGSRFPPPMIASGVFGGFFRKDYAYARQDSNGLKIDEELERIDYKGKTRCGDHKLGAYFELHIEQGPILENERKVIGIITGAQGMRWYEVTVTGRESHAGSTPMPLRRDAMLACARVVEAVNRIALKHPPGVSTVGLVRVKPNSPNVVPGLVFFSVDLRHPEAAVLQQMDDELREALDKVASAMKIKTKLETTWDSPAVRFDKTCIGAIRDAAGSGGYSHRDMLSGTGHDAVYVSRVAPAAMIFIPCREGIGHSELEYAKPEDVAAGANVLLQAVLRYNLILSGG